MGAVVGDGWGADQVDEDGVYVLACGRCSGTIELTVHFANTRVAYRHVDVLLPGEYVVDFPDTEFLLSVVEPIPWRPVLFTTTPATLTYRARVTAPVDGLCVTGTDSRTGEATDLAIEETTEPSTTRWSGSLTIPVDARAGRHRVVLEAVDCATGTRLSRSSDEYASAQYRVDLHAPEVRVTRPAAGQTYIADVDLGPSNDGEARAMGVIELEAEATDDSGLGDAVFEVTDPDGGTGTCRSSGYDQLERRFNCGIWVSSAPGVHTVTVTVTDLAGRRSTASRSFVWGVTP